MADRHAQRRAGQYRQRAQELTAAAAQPRDECDRRHMLDQAATFERAADALAPLPAPPPEPAWRQQGRCCHKRRLEYRLMVRRRSERRPPGWV